MKINGLINTFKIFPHWKLKTNEYYKVFIFDSYKSMYEYYNNTGGYLECDFDGICRDLEIYKGEIKLNKIGEILIPIDKCDIKVITHECGHAIFQYMRKINKEDMWKYIDENNCWKGEEMYCQLLGEMVSQFMSKKYIINIKENKNMLVEFKACKDCLCISCYCAYDCPKVKGLTCVECSGDLPKSPEECEYYEEG